MYSADKRHFLSAIFLSIFIQLLQLFLIEKVIHDDYYLAMLTGSVLAVVKNS